MSYSCWDISDEWHHWRTNVEIPTGSALLALFLFLVLVHVIVFSWLCSVAVARIVLLINHTLFLFLESYISQKLYIFPKCLSSPPIRKIWLLVNRIFWESLFIDVFRLAEYQSEPNLVVIIRFLVVSGKKCDIEVASECTVLLHKSDW